MKRLLIAGLTSLIIIIIIGCGTETGTGPGGTPMPMPYQEEAEQMALYYSGEFRPPAPLTSRISSELYAIRSTLGEQIPEVNWSFSLPWVKNTVSTGWVDSIAALIEDSAYAPFDSLVEHFGLLNYGGIWRRYITFGSPKAVHPWHLADSISRVSGVTFAKACETGQLRGHYFARSASARGIDYYFWIERCPELWGRLLWIQVRGGKAELKGEHYECPPEGYVAGWEQYVDDAEANRPAWVNKARDAFARLDYWGPNYEWRDR